MPKLPNPKTDEAAALTAAITASGRGKAAVAEALDVSPGLISQYASGHRPVPWDRAEAIAVLVGTQPESISVEYRRILESFGPSQLQRLTADIIAHAVTLARESLKLGANVLFDVEEHPDVFAQAIRAAIAEIYSGKGGSYESSQGDGKARGIGGSTRKAETRTEAKPASGKRRKAA